METPIYKSNPTPNPEAFPAIRQAAIFLQDINNTKKKWRGLTYTEVRRLVEAFILAFNPEEDSENISVENLIKKLNALLLEEAEKSKSNIESVVPPELQALLEEYEKYEKEAKGKAKIYEQKTAAKTKEFIERTQARLEYQKRLAFFREAVEKVTVDFESKLSEGVTSDKQTMIAQVIAEELPVQEGIELSLEKISDLPPEARKIEEAKIVEKISTSIKEVIPNITEKLKGRGVEITSEEAKVIARVQPITKLPFFAQQLAKPASERQEFTAWFREQLSPAATPSEAQEISKDLIPAILGKLPELDTKTLSKLSEKEFAELKGQIEEAVVAAIAEVAPELGEILPAKIPRLITSFVPQNIQELNGLAPILAVAIERRTVIPTVIPPPAPPEPIVVTKLFTRGPFLFASPLKRASGGDIWQIKEKGENIVDQIRRRLYQEGLNQTNSPDFRNKTLELWASRLTTQGITPEDIDYTVKRLQMAGEKDDSPRIKELNEIRKALSTFQQQLPTSFIEKIKKEGQIEGLKGHRIVPLDSRFVTFIVRQAEFNPKYNLVTRIKSFFGGFFGKKTVIVGQNQLLSIDKLSFQTSRLFESLKAGFFRTSFGRGFQIGLQKLGQKSLQALWDTAKTGAKQIIQTGVKAILHAIGISVSAGVLNVITVVLPKLFRLGSFLVRGVGKLIISGFGILDFALAGITGQREVQENKTFSWLKPLLIISLVVLLFLVVFQMTATGGAFVSETSLVDRDIQEPAAGCFVFVGSWTEEDKQLINEAIGRITSYSQLYNTVCSDNSINLLRINSDDYCTKVSNSEINITNKCLGNSENTVYSLTHEVGHVFAAKNFSAYLSFLWEVSRTENLLCSYPIEERRGYAEDFPETIAVYVTNIHYPQHVYSRCNGPINMASEYPIHYNFIKDKL